MKHLLTSIEVLALSLGGVGLFLVTFLDSSVLSLPELSDILIIWMVTQHKSRLVYYALMAVVGSLAGCFVMYYLGWKGGEAFLQKRFKADHVERAMAAIRRYGLFAVLIPAILPPPAPFKIFVILAGVARISPTRFALAILIGRSVRYFGEGLLAVWYGDRAINYLRENGARVSLIAVGVLALGLAGVMLWRRWRAR